MNVEVDEFAVVNLQNLRKRKRNEAAWKKNKAKCARYSGKSDDKALITNTKIRGKIQIIFFLIKGFF